MDRPSIQTRRQFLKLVGGSATLALLPGRLRSADEPRPPFEVSATLYAWELHDEGVERVLDNLQEMSAVNSVYLVGIMHPERRPFSTGSFPHNPLRQTWTAEDARCYWHPDPKRYGRIQPRESDYDWLNQTDWLRALTEAARKRGLRTGVEFSHVLVDRGRAEGAFADVVQRNIRGEITHVRPNFRPLCPNHPATREYVLGLASDVILNHGVDYIQSCIIPFDEGGPAAGACFCDTCKRAAGEQGFDLGQAQETLRNDPGARPALDDWLQFRYRSTARFYQALHGGAHALKPGVDLRFNLFMTRHNPQDWGIDLTAMKPHLDSLRVMDYSEQNGDPAMMSQKRDYLAATRRQLGPDFPIHSAVAVRLKATPEVIRQGVKIAVDCGMNGITLAHYDGATFPILRAVRDGLVAAGIPAAPAPAVKGR